MNAIAETDNGQIFLEYERSFGHSAICHWIAEEPGCGCVILCRMTLQYLRSARWVEQKSYAATATLKKQCIGLFVRLVVFILLSAAWPADCVEID